MSASENSFLKSLFFGQIREEFIFPYPKPKAETAETVGMIVDTIDKFGKDLAKEDLDQMRIDMTEALRLQAVTKIRRTMTIERVWPPQPKKPGV
jgi:hypothetical protein